MSLELEAARQDMDVEMFHSCASNAIFKAERIASRLGMILRHGYIAMTLVKSMACP